MSAMPGNSHQSPIDKLDTPCLVRVLQHVSPQQQLVVCAAVCSKWRQATREAISDIDIFKCTQEKCDQLQQWAVLTPAALNRLALCGDGSVMLGFLPQPCLQLQLSVLQPLKEIQLAGVLLAAVTADGSVLQLVDLLPRLQQCTQLTCSGWNLDPQLAAATAAFHAMPALQDLYIYGEEVGLPERLVALPATLTRLCLTSYSVINATTAAAISQLTRLRVLWAEAVSFDLDLLANCTSLERVEIDIKESNRSFSGMKGSAVPLLVFANMPNLQHLDLESDAEGPVVTAAEVAALSASSNLTRLSLCCSEYCALPPAAYDTWFPPGCQCPHLQYLHIGVWTLGNTAAVQRMVSACPGLVDLQLLALHFPSGDDAEMGSACVAASLQALTNLTGLTLLFIECRGLPQGVSISPDVVKSWSHWTSLHTLYLEEMEYRQLEDVLGLSQLRSLRELSIKGSDDCPLTLNLQAQASGPPDVWSQLPAAVWGEAIRQKEQELQRRQREHAAAVERAVAYQRLQAEAQAKAAALQEQMAADQAELAVLLQKQRQAEATAALRDLLQEQQAELAAIIQAEADQTQTNQLQGQVASLQATVGADLEH